MKFLNTKEIGFDHNSIGFPSVKTCQAIVYQTSIGLFGYHDSYGTAQAFPLKCDTMRQFVQSVSINHSDHAVCLIGAITSYERFKKGQDDAWGAELLQVATALGFTGDVWGVRVDSHVQKDDSAYIRVDTVGGTMQRATVSYKTWSKMDYDTSAKLDKDPAQFGMLAPRPLTNDMVRGMNFTEMQQAKDQSPYDMTMPPLDSYGVKRRGKGDEGTLNSATKFVKFQ